MKTNNSMLMLLPLKIKTKGLYVTWYSNDQMRWYEEMKDDKYHGDYKGWWRDGQLHWHYLYENGILVKRIV